MKTTYTYHRLIFFLAIATALAGCQNRRGRNNEVRPDVQVAVTELKLGDIVSTLRLTGTVKALSKAEIKTETQGLYRLKTNPRTGKRYALGDRVKKGEVIVALEDMELENDIRIESKEMKLELNKNEFEKQKSLFEKGGVTLRELRTSESNFLNSKYDLEKAKIMLARLNVRAPFDGLITDLPHMTEGVKAASGTKVFELMNDKKLLLEAQMQERYFSSMKKGLEVQVGNYNQKDRLKGKLTGFSPAIDPSSRTFKAKILIDNPKGSLKAGMFVQAKVELDSRSSVISIPKDIIRQARKGQLVYVVEKKLAKERVLELGLENDEYVEVKTGLKKGDRLVIKGYEMLRNDAKVKVLK
ncbi:MAG: efflux RND transporter periplasmic adaptor subunit [Cytophagales bacterium]|nr:efflux RND transporter periplasmic adaptor subunit [Cytophagales bacterium]